MESRDGHSSYTGWDLICKHGEAIPWMGKCCWESMVTDEVLE